MLASSSSVSARPSRSATTSSPSSPGWGCALADLFLVDLGEHRHHLRRRAFGVDAHVVNEAVYPRDPLRPSRGVKPRMRRIN